MNPLVPALVSVLGVGGVMGLVAGLRRVPVPTAAPATPRLLAGLARVPRRVLVVGGVGGGNALQGRARPKGGAAS